MKHKMRKLGRRNYDLLTFQCFNTFEEGYYHAEEKLYMHEADEILAFCMWCDAEVKPFGHGNYEDRFQEFLSAKNDLKSLVEQWRGK